MVACDAYGDDSAYTDEPVLVVEVLSPATASIDRREKSVNYMKIETLSEYVLVHQRRKKIEVYRKNVVGGWELFEFGAGDELVLKSIPKGDLIVAVDTIYDGVRGKRFADGRLEVREDAEAIEYLSPEDILEIDF